MTDESKKSQLRLALPEFSIAGRTLRVELTGLPLIVFVASFVLLIAAIVFEVRTQPDGWVKVLTTACFVLLPILISLLLAPRQKSEDHSLLSLHAVEELKELQRSQVSIVDDLNGIDVSRLDPRDHTKILTSINYLSQHHRLLRLHIAYWGKVSPSVAKDLADRENTIKEIMSESNESDGIGETA